MITTITVVWLRKLPTQLLIEQMVLSSQAEFEPPLLTLRWQKLV